MNQQLKNRILSKLRIGAIQPFQVAEELKLACIPEFEIEKTKREILKRPTTMNIGAIK